MTDPKMNIEKTNSRGFLVSTIKHLSPIPIIRKKCLQGFIDDAYLTLMLLVASIKLGKKTWKK